MSVGVVALILVVLGIGQWIRARTPGGGVLASVAIGAPWHYLCAVHGGAHGGAGTVVLPVHGIVTQPVLGDHHAAAAQWADLHGERVWWAESRPAEGGRVALVRDGADVLPAPWNARNRVHEYGGRPFVVLSEDRVAFKKWADQRV